MANICFLVFQLANLDAAQLHFGRGTNGIPINRYYTASGSPGGTNDLNVDMGPTDLIEEYSYIKFENLFGGQLNQIPYGAVIVSATLTLTTKNESEDATRVHLLLQDISERPANINTSEANSFYVEAELDSNTPLQREESHTLDVTEGVRAWSRGEPNHGLLLLPTGRDGTLYYSAEGNLEISPLLTVEYNTSLNTGLVAFYDFNGNADDTSGNNNHIRRLTGANLSRDRFGNVDNAMNFHSSGVGIVPSSESLKIRGSSISLMAWVCPSQYIPLEGGNGNRHTILRKMSHTGNFGGYALSLRHTDGAINFAARLIDGGSIDISANGPSPEPNKWSHVAISCDGEEVKYFLNGKLIDTAIKRVELEVDDDDLAIGQLSENDETENFHGKLDQIRIYNRTLHPEEIKKAYSNVAIKSYSGLTIVGELGANYRIDAASNLAEPTNWLPLTNITLTTCPFIWIDFDSAFFPRRFYRAVEVE